MTQRYRVACALIDLYWEVAGELPIDYLDVYREPDGSVDWAECCDFLAAVIFGPQPDPEPIDIFSHPNNHWWSGLEGGEYSPEGGE